MRYRMMTAAGVLALMASGVGAQTVDKRVSLEPAHSPFTYEALGATPSLRFDKTTTTGGEKVVAARDNAAARDSINRAATPSDTATVASPSGLPRAARQ